jgi:hypothetical protein
MKNFHTNKFYLLNCQISKNVSSRQYLLLIITLSNPHWARVVGYGPFSLCVIHKEGLCPSNWVINWLMVTLSTKFHQSNGLHT